PSAPAMRRQIPPALPCFGLGCGLDALMDAWEWLSFYPHTWQAFAALYARGIWFAAAHATGNLVLALAIGPELRRLLERYARRLRAEVEIGRASCRGGRWGGEVAGVRARGRDGRG